MSQLMQTIMTRKSIRTYDGKPVSAEHRKDIEEYMKDIRNPFNIPVEFMLLDADAHNLSSPVLSGEQLYVTGTVEKKPYADVAFGYSFEKLVLHAWTLGLGTVWIGGTMKRELFEAAAGVKEGEMMPCVSPLGYPAKKKSLKETMMRKGVGADNRIAADELFFDEKWGQPLETDGGIAADGDAADGGIAADGGAADSGIAADGGGEVEASAVAELLEMVRWAPSAVNKQPWRIIRRDGVYHFYEKKDKGYEHPNTGDLQKIDVGIALAHFTMGLEEQGLHAEVTVSDPGIEIPGDAEYIASVAIHA